MFGMDLISVTTVLTVVTSFAGLNYFRGGWDILNFLPLRRAYWAFAIMALIAYAITFNWMFALAFLVGTVVEWLPGWGFCYQLGRHKWKEDPRATHWGKNDPRRKQIYYKLFAWMQSEHIMFFVRHMFVAPFVAFMIFYFGAPAILGLIVPIYAAMVLLAYEISWTVDRYGHPIRIAEIASGGIYGAFLIVMALFI